MRRIGRRGFLAGALAWRNPGTKPATLIFILIGARRENA
jgi:hypothetical protein